jgi:hypothetical protein
MERYIFWEADSRSASQEIPALLMQHEGSWPCLQEPAAREQRHSTESSPHPVSKFIYDPRSYYPLICV